VIPARLHGLAAEVELAGAPLRILYRIQREGCGPTGLCLNGRELPFEREPNPYRPGGAVVSLAAMRELSAASGNELVVDLA
jgi:hypothetical protein